MSLELIAASRGVGIEVMAEIFWRVLDVFGMPVEWSLGIMLPIFKGKGDIRSCSCSTVVRLLEHEMKVVEKCFID